MNPPRLYLQFVEIVAYAGDQPDELVDVKDASEFYLSFDFRGLVVS